jgi:RND superfamily putative drug exporter
MRRPENVRTPAQRRDARRRNRQAIVYGQADSGRIILAAAVIMVLVFGSFLLNGSRLLQEFGFGLGFAVLVDALIIRSIAVPAIMHLIGPRNWYLPRTLGRMLPNLAVEAADGPATSTPEPRSIPVS